MAAPLNQKMENNDLNLLFFEKLIQEKLELLNHELLEIKGTLNLYKDQCQILTQKTLERENNIEGLKNEQASLKREVAQ